MAKKSGRRQSHKGPRRKKGKRSRTKQRRSGQDAVPVITPGPPSSGPIAELQALLPSARSAHELAILADPAHQPDWLPWGLRGKLAALWTPSRVAPLSTQALLELLAAHGVAVDRAAFLELARGRTRAWGIADEVWLPRAQGRGRDLPENLLGLVAVELWKRWLPDRPSSDVLGSWLAEGYRLRRADRDAACRTWLRMWDTLRERMGSGRSLETARRLVDGGPNVQHWFVDLACELRIVTADAPELGPRAVAFCQDVVRRSFSGREAWSKGQFRGALGDILFHLGRRDEGERVYRGVIDSGTVWSSAADRMCLAEALAYSTDAATEEEIARAVALLEPVPDPGVGLGDEAEARQRMDCLRAFPPREPRRPVPRLLEVGEYVPRILSQRILAAGDAVVPELVALVEQDVGDTDENVQWAAVHAVGLLGEMGAGAAVEPMLRYFDRCDAYSEGGRACTEALRRMGPAAVDPLLEAHGSTPDRHRRSALRNALAGLDVQDRRILDLLLESACEDGRGAGFNLWLYGDEQAIPILQRRLEHLDGDEARSVQQALEEIGGETVLNGAVGA